jgi:hypothetical protein
MDTSLYLSQVLGLIILIMSLGFAIQPHHYQNVFHELMNQAGLKFLSGLIPLIGGTLLILTPHTWYTNWDIFIGVTCWVIFAKGVLRIIVPKISDRMVLKCIDRPIYIKISVGLGILYGLALCYHGFYGLVA